VWAIGTGLTGHPKAQSAHAFDPKAACTAVRHGRPRASDCLSTDVASSPDNCRPSSWPGRHRVSCRRRELEAADFLAIIRGWTDVLPGRRHDSKLEGQTPWTTSRFLMCDRHPHAFLIFLILIKRGKGGWARRRHSAEGRSSAFGARPATCSPGLTGGVAIAWTCSPNVDGRSTIAIASDPMERPRRCHRGRFPAPSSVAIEGANVKGFKHPRSPPPSGPNQPEAIFPADVKALTDLPDPLGLPADPPNPEGLTGVGSQELTLAT